MAVETMTAESLHSQFERGDRTIFAQATAEARKIFVNGKLLRGYDSPKALVDRLNRALQSTGDNVRFDFDDSSFLIVTATTAAGCEADAHVEWGFWEQAGHAIH